MLKPLPYPHPEQLVGVWHSSAVLKLPDLNMAVSNYFVYREQNRYFQDVGLYNGDSVSVTGLGKPEQVQTVDVTEGTLPVLGVQPLLGRLFNQSDEQPKSTQTAILMYGYWQKRFGGDPAIVGKTLTTDGKLRQIIGVMPREFRFLDYDDLQMILPDQFDRNKTILGEFSYQGVARLKPGATIAQANADVARMLPIVWRSFPPPAGFSAEIFEKAEIQPNVKPLKQVVVGDTGKILWILMGSIALVLLIACANVANLLLVRAEGRQQELAIRAALGASRGRIAADLLSESVIIGLLGSALGLGLAYGALRILLTMAPAGIPRIHEIGIDLPVLLFTMVVSLLASLLFGAIPVFKYAGRRLGTGLREGGRSLSQTRERHRARNTLVVVQVGLASVLLVCAGLMIRTFRALINVNPGFDAQAAVQTFGLTIPAAEVRDQETVVRMQQAMAERIAAIPGVSAVAMANAVPNDNGQWMDLVYAQDKPYENGEIPPLRRFNFVSPGFFAALKIPMVAGRDFTWEDVYKRLPVAIISENFAREYWGSPLNALGKQIRTSSKDDWREIVGVVGDVYSDGTSQKAPSYAYWPILMSHFGTDDVEIRRSLQYVICAPQAGSENFMSEVRQAVWSVDGNLPLINARTLGELYTKSMARTSFTLTMIAIAGGMALLLGMIGLYGVVAYSISQRTREIGIRIALGAQRNTVTGMFVRQGLALTAIGVAVGLVAAAATTHLLASVLFQVSPVDPMTYVLVCAMLVGIAALASYIPSRRAAVVDPIEALRSE